MLLVSADSKPSACKPAGPSHSGFGLAELIFLRVETELFQETLYCQVPTCKALELCFYSPLTLLPRCLLFLPHIIFLGVF